LPVALAVAGLPAGIKLAKTTLPAGQPAVEILLDADKAAPAGSARLSVTGTATLAARLPTLVPLVAGGGL